MVAIEGISAVHHESVLQLGGRVVGSGEFTFGRCATDRPFRCPPSLMSFPLARAMSGKVEQEKRGGEKEGGGTPRCCF